MDALYYTVKENNTIQCELCPHNCIIKDKESGICKVRKNVDGKLISTNYGLISSMGFDPIEKKPLYHFYPGEEILSVGSFGCNLKCQFCQNWQISQTALDELVRENMISSPEKVAQIAHAKKSN